MESWQKSYLLAQADQYQRECILDDSERALIVARAGSGKTFTMTTKALYLIANKNISPAEIEFLAFNRKAAAEINERLSAQISGLQLADTFHTLALRLAGVASDKVLENLENTNEASDDLLNYRQVFALAAEKVKKLRGAYTIQLQNRIMSPCSLKYLIIDEYQDFTADYYQIIQAILQVNPACKLICIGDDWQAINGFAGSDLKFFLNFREYFPGAKILHLPINYRCAKKIVAAANNFMTAEYLHGQAEHKVIAARKNRAIIKIIGETKLTEIGRNGYLGQLGRIIQKHFRKLRTQPDYKIAILSRCNKIGMLSLEYLNLQIQNFLEQYGIAAHVDVSTIHKYKGKQADTIIIFPAVKKILPLKGSDPAEEKRLFYVAITRAKDELYFITDTEQNHRSPYLQSLQHHPFWQDLWRIVF
jgi:DNA helicase-4